MQDIFLFFAVLFISLFVMQVSEIMAHKDIMKKLEEIKKMIKDKCEESNYSEAIRPPEFDAPGFRVISKGEKGGKIK